MIEDFLNWNFGLSCSAFCGEKQTVKKNAAQKNGNATLLQANFTFTPHKRAAQY
jgi:hypothetical protein